MAIEKFRTRVFVTTALTINGTAVLPYGTAAPTLGANGAIRIDHVTGTARITLRSGGSTYTLALGTATSNGSITLTSA